MVRADRGWGGPRCADVRKWAVVGEVGRDGDEWNSVGMDLGG